MSFITDAVQRSQAQSRPQSLDPVTGLPFLGDVGNANDNLAQVTRALWDDYQRNYAPFQYEMLGNLTTQNPGIVAESVAKAQQQAGQAFDTAAQNRTVTMSRFGMAPDAQTRASMERQTQLDRTATMAGAANATRRSLKDRDMQLMTSGVPNVAGRSYGMQGG